MTNAAVTAILSALQAAGLHPHLTEHDVITVETPDQTGYEITIRESFADPETNVEYDTWRNDHECSRLGRVYEHAPHWAERFRCPLCEQPLANGQPVQVFVLGPEPQDRDDHAEGKPYTAKGLLAHAICLQGRLTAGP